jgi:hypothetical protein
MMATHGATVLSFENSQNEKPTISPMILSLDKNENRSTPSESTPEASLAPPTTTTNTKRQNVKITKRQIFDFAYDFRRLSKTKKTINYFRVSSGNVKVVTANFKRQKSKLRLKIKLSTTRKQGPDAKPSICDASRYLGNRTSRTCSAATRRLKVRDDVDN